MVRRLTLSVRSEVQGAKPLHVQRAFHSALIEPAAEEARKRKAIKYLSVFGGLGAKVSLRIGNVAGHSWPKLTALCGFEYF